MFLCYLFVGVSIAADLFMDGIMQITSTKKKVERKNEKGETVIVEVPVWNWVVANISLMALGTSAPEIMLSLIEAILTLNKPAGELGPSCIVGSAAYNYLMISAVCTCAIPANTYKSITQLRVYVTTCIWSLWAYIWMIVVYRWWTPDEVTLVEALLTLGFFVMLLLCAWVVDTQPWKKKVYPSGDAPSLEAAEDGVKSTAVSVRSVEDQQSAKNAAFFSTIMQQRMARSTRGKLRAKQGEDDLPVFSRANSVVERSTLLRPGDRQQVMFRSSAYSCLESTGVAKIAVVRVPARGGTLDKPLRVHYRTEDGDAVAGLDYEATEGNLFFAPGEDVTYILIKIVDDDVSEPDVTFNVVLTHVESLDPSDPEPIIAQKSVSVTIVDDDDAGLLGFELPHYEVSYNANHLYAEVSVVRRRGADGTVQVEYLTMDDSAMAGADYVASQGKLVFESGQKSCQLRIPLLPTASPEAHKSFRIQLRSPAGGAELSSRCSTGVTIVRRAMTMAHHGKEGLEAVGGLKGTLGSSSSIKSVKLGQDAEVYNVWKAWRLQIKASFEVGGDDDDSGSAGGSEKGWGKLILHYVMFTWRIILCTIVPPAEWKGGYPCFIAALGTVVAIVYLVNEAGVLFGCVVGLKDIMTGISIVAMGTSLPDTLASRISAVQDPDADAAIGNITGSNSVNVFLGLGLPWIICSVYYKLKGEKYITPAGDLSFSVMLYAILGGVGIGILALARRYGGELGGPKRRQYSIAATLTCLWLLYLILSGLRAYGEITTNI